MLIITGTIAYDYIMDFPDSFAKHILPNQIHKLNLSFIVDKFAKRRGGTAGNVSYTLGLLGIENILYSVAGKDFEEYKNAFFKLGMTVSHVVIDPDNYTATGFAMTDSADNQIWGYYYGAASGIESLSLASVVNKNDFVLIGPSGAKGSMSLVKQSVKLSVPYLFDPGFILTQISDKDLIYGVEHAKYIIGNDYEIQLIQDRVDLNSKKFKEKIVITTLGKEGARIKTPDKIYMIPPVKTNKVVDPTGAGDAWRAGFLAGLTRGYDFQICGQMGSVASSYAIETYGTQEHFFTQSQFQGKYRQTFGELIKL